jgi:glycosyltransferase involved in cell wall biosynthesis
LSNLLNRLRIETQDLIRHNRLSKALLSRVLAGAAVLAPSRGGRRLALLARAARGCTSDSRMARLDRRINAETRRLQLDALDWCRVCPAPTDRPSLQKALIVKPPVSAHEKGVLYITFEDQWIRLLRTGRAEDIARRYDLLLGPTWSPPHAPALLIAIRMWPATVYTLVSNLADPPVMRRLSDHLVPIPLLASSWVNPAPYEKYLAEKKVYDILMVANFSPYKRHWRLFRMLRELPRDRRVRLIGTPDGDRDRDVLLAEARAFGVADRFELCIGVPYDELIHSICSSRVSLIFSKQEGSCIAITESLFGNTPVGVFKDSIIGSKAFVNEQTGVLLEDRGLGSQVERFVENASNGKYRPRDWALANISCHRSYETLNTMFRLEAERRGTLWTRDLERFHQNDRPRYLDVATAEKMNVWYQAFENDYGIRIELQVN